MGGGAVPWVIRDVVRDINRAAGRRWRVLDPLLPVPGDLTAGCAEPFQVTGRDGRPAGFAVCRHQVFPEDSLSQTWGTAARFVLTPRLRDRDTAPALDDLLDQWRDHLEQLDEAQADDTSALVTWPTRDISGVRALLGHGLQPMTVLAVRPAKRLVPARKTDVSIRRATLDDLDAVVAMEMGVIRYDEQFGGSVPRPRTEELVRADTQIALGKQPEWTWLALRAGRPAGLLVVQPPTEATWVATMTGGRPAAYLSTLFVMPDDRGSGAGAALVRHAHAQLDEQGVDVTLLHHSQVNPVSGPFWNRMGYRPLWTSWENRPAAAIR
jgi:ribosomal protein S18 acetylase RimI-like enzyme